MGSEVRWFEKPLGAVTCNHDGKRKPVKESERKKGAYPYYGASGIVDYVDGYLFEGRHLLIAEDGENLRTRQTPIAFMADGKFWVNNHAHIVTGNGEVTTEYLHYFLQNADIQPYLTGAVMPKLTQGNLNRIPVRYPEPEYQKSIVRVLGALDDKIDLNRRINQTLEQMAQAIFKSWFVDFDPVKAKIAAIQEGRDPLRAAVSAISGKTDTELDQLPPEQHQQLVATAALFPDEMVDSELGEIPKGWQSSELRLLTEVISKGTTPSKPDLANAKDEPTIPFIKVKDISESGEIIRGNLELIAKSIHETSLKRSILKTDDLLFSIAGTIGRTAFVDHDLNGANVNQAIAFIRLNDKPAYIPLCWLTLRSIETQNFIASKVVQAVQANASLANVGDIPVMLPDQSVLEKWNSLVHPVLFEYRSRQREMRNLSNLRDTLLPKLLSGELSVTETMAEVET